MVCRALNTWDSTCFNAKLIVQITWHQVSAASYSMIHAPLWNSQWTDTILPARGNQYLNLICMYIYIVTACHFQAVVPYTHWARLARGYFLLRWVRRVFYLHWISEPCQAQHRKHHKAVIVFHVTSCGCHFNIAANMPTNDQNIQVAASMKTGLLSICDATFGWCLTKLLTSASSSMEPARAFPRDLLQRSKIHSCLYDIPTQLYIHIDLHKTGYQSIEDPCWF